MRQILFTLSFAILSLAVAGCKKSDDIKPRPVADFTYSVVASSNVTKVYEFISTSKNTDRHQWSTSTGVANSGSSLILTVSENSRINVSLTAKNDVGEDTKTQSVDVTGLATTGSFVFYTNVPDKGDISVYVNNVLQGRINKYYSSGTPSCGEQGSVTVTLPPGSYPFTAKSEGLLPYSWSGNFTVVRGVCNSTKLTGK